MSGPSEMYKTFLNFEPTETPPWRERLEDKEKIPSIKDMLNNIIGYQQTYEKVKESVPHDVHKKVVRKLLVSFFLHVQKEEDIGVQDRGKTEELLESAVQEQEPSTPSQKSERQSSLEFELIDEYRKSDVKPEKSELETINLCRAYLYIERLINEADRESIGFIDLESCVQEVHKIAMREILPKPGKFSVSRRVANFKGEVHCYPCFLKEEIAGEGLLTLIDKYNALVREIRCNNSDHDETLRTLLSFKCASKFLFALLTLHPFKDGNGRVARLLASYSLWTQCPFMTPIYNVFSSTCEGDYVEALVNARQGLELKDDLESVEEAQKAVLETLTQSPSDLCAMLIESNWAMWRQCLKELQVAQIDLYDWEVDRTN